jgi:hypothetical protein
MQDVVALVRKGVDMADAIRIVAAMHGLPTQSADGATLQWKLKELNALLFLEARDRQGKLLP